jgi:hypothetical protein
MPPAKRPNGTLGENEWVGGLGGARLVFRDDNVDDAALFVGPLHARRAFAGATKPKSFLGGTALARYFDEGSIDDDPLFRKCDRAVRQHDPDQT